MWPRYSPGVLIADDGELGELRAVLGALGVSFAETSEAEDPAPALHAELLFTTPRHALRFQMRGREDGGATARDHVVVIGAGQRTLGKLLERGGCDFVLREPVHREVYRLLVERSLYRGDERRRHPRVAMGSPVKLRMGRRTVPATLGQLSRHGCGLVVEGPVDAGTRLTVLLPAELTEGDTLALEGQVPASGPGSPAQDGAKDGPQHVSMVFGRVSGTSARRLRRLLSERAASGASLVPHARPRSDPAGAVETAMLEEPEWDEAAPASADRRRSPRAHFADRVLASGGGGAHVLAGRDLSVDGMRVERHPDLAVGDEFKLALYGRRGSPALLLRARVARDAGRRGWVLHFRDVTPKLVARLEELVAALPRLDAPLDEDAGPVLVLTEIVDGD